MKNFANIDTAGINHGQTMTAAEFRKLAKLEVVTNTEQPTRRTKKDKKKSNNHSKDGVELPWYATYLSEVVRLESEPELIDRDREYYYQVKIMLHIAKTYPELKYITHASPNGGRRDGFEAVRLTFAGLRKGHPDLQIIRPNDLYTSLFIEMKKCVSDYGTERTAYREVSIEQHECRVALLSSGALSIVAFGYEEAISAIDAYMNNQKVNDKILNRWDDYDWRTLAKAS